MLSLTTPSSSLSLPLKNPNDHFSTPLEVQQLHAQCLKQSLPFPPRLLPQAASICSVSLCPSVFSYSFSLVEHYSTNPTFVYNSVLRSLPPRSSISLFLRLHDVGLEFDQFTFCFVLKSVSESKELMLGRTMHGLVEKLGFKFDVYISNALLQLYATNGRLDLARQLFDKMVVRDVVSYNTIIAPLSKVGKLETARQLFDEMPHKSVRSWTAIIAGYVQCKNPKEAIKLYLKMEKRPNMNPNEVTIVALLAACADLGFLDLGKRIHQYAIIHKYDKNVRICNTLIDMYTKCGCVEIARKVFDEMPDESRTIVSWSAMICGHAMHGQGEKTLHLFHKMINQGFKPNGVTFVGLLHACSHMGLVAIGREYFSIMKNVYKIVPTVEHYGCMVDLLSRAGLLYEAFEFIKKMPIEPNIVVWGALLGGAKLHKNIEIGEEAIKRLVKLDPQNDGYYVTLSNIYAESGFWDDVARIRQLMKNEGVKKTRGWSRISINGIVHEFLAGDDKHPEINEIHEKWEKLVREMKSKGYVPDLSVVVLDLEEREKERVLYTHSEKLAVVYGIISTEPGTIIRVMKNLRVCDDCHVAMKLISDISGREIIVKDRNRFHCFKDGVCSCRDYW
ncbi:hypothetical protein LUZ60_000114 [Juncus effusus]|nr:hypothetical protein LUZ60_000114 [Juncus effusus]